MKKRGYLFLCVVLAMILMGCSTDGTKKVENEEITLQMNVGERKGVYTGEVVDGLPNGQGKFETANQEGIKWYYEGNFVNGAFDGEGITVWEDGEIRRGNYKNFIWEPNSAQLFETLNSIGKLGLSESAKKFISEKPDIFPVEDVATLNSDIDESVSYKMITKECGKYGNKIAKFTNIYIAQIFVTYVDEKEPKSKYTYMTAQDEEFNIYELFYIGDIPELYDGDTVKAIYGVPISNGGYETVSGGYANTIQLAVCYLEK